LLEAERIECGGRPEALQLVAALLRQEAALLLGFRALGVDLQIQRPRYLDHGAHDRGVALVAGQAADEALVDP
jgi:hypothetical protein